MIHCETQEKQLKLASRIQMVQLLQFYYNRHVGRNNIISIFEPNLRVHVQEWAQNKKLIQLCLI